MLAAAIAPDPVIQGAVEFAGWRDKPGNCAETDRWTENPPLGMATGL